MDLETSPEKQLFEETKTRELCDFKDLSSKFKLESRVFSRQYAHIYSKRLIQMKDTLVKRAAQKWGKYMSISFQCLH